MKKSIQRAVGASFAKSAGLAALFSTALALAITTYSVRQVVDRAEMLACGVPESVSLEETWRILQEAFRLPVGLQEYRAGALIDERLLPRTDSRHRWVVQRACTAKRAQGLSSELVISIDATPALVVAGWSLGLVLLIFFTCFIGLARSMRRRLSQFVGQIAQVEAWMRSPETATPPESATLRETSQLVEAARALDASMRQATRKLRDSSLDQGRMEIARGTAQELRPPVAALSLILQRLPDLGAESIEAAQGALTKIRAVTSNLMRASGDPDHATAQELAATAEPILALVERVLHSKRVEVRDRPRVRIDAGSLPQFPGPFAKVDPAALAGILCNLLDNSVDALIGSEGRIRVDVLEFPQKSLVEIRISDDGVGVPQDVISTLGVKRSQGDGLYQAFHRVKDWGGQLSLSRRPDRGTICTIRLPMSSGPHWFASSVRIPRGAQILVLEKDPETLAAWSELAAEAGSAVSIRLLSRGVDFDAFIRERREARPDVIFVSHELGDELVNGLDLIDANRMTGRSYLVSSSFENRSLRRRADR
ncbi:MAG TPA: HAMP domain-containing sensor histidine kinase, partial [Bdellovibrionota bacterium]|nr:HAMP domain-containing sensor histidine kinase [Bdellovibrionota bacterium]